jgi:pyrimidine-nucleoside phosphorylase
MSALLPQELIRKKRDDERLSAEEVRAFIAGVTTGEIPDEQVAAMLMAIFFRGLADDELAAWADAMLHSGDVLDLPNVTRPKVDKHSTGGVGDKISIPLAPAVAACGAAVPMVSGRGLGHTGGTLDKLESIPGFRVNLDAKTFAELVERLGVCLIGQTERIAPADRRLYALRDVTGTVESIPLIASSIMSKKLAEGIDALVLDCKVGHGAFMKTQERARELARAIQVIGRSKGTDVTAVLTSMDAPIGRYVGNALEMLESIEVMRGGGPRDTRELTAVLGGEMLRMAGLADTPEAGAARIERALDDGSALALFGQIVEAQGGDPRVIDDPNQVLPQAREREPVVAARPGVVSSIAAADVGIGALMLGAGRRRKEDAVDHAVGVELLCEVGDRVEEGQPLAYLLHNGAGVDGARARVAGAIEVGDEGARLDSRILEVLR